jgi:hypothetical protein
VDSAVLISKHEQSNKKCGSKQGKRCEEITYVNILITQLCEPSIHHDISYTNIEMICSKVNIYSVLFCLSTTWSV